MAWLKSLVTHKRRTIRDTRISGTQTVEPRHIVRKECFLRVRRVGIRETAVSLELDRLLKLGVPCNGVHVTEGGVSGTFDFSPSRGQRGRCSAHIETRAWGDRDKAFALQHLSKINAPDALSPRLQSTGVLVQYRLTQSRAPADDTQQT